MSSSEEDNTMEELLTRRRVLKSRLTRIENALTTLGDDPSQAAVEVYMEQVERLQRDLQAFEDDILAAVPPAEYENHENECNAMTNRCLAVKIALREKIQPPPQQAVQPPAAAGAGGVGVRGHVGVKLPKLEIPKFSGNLYDWISFRDRFVAAIHNKPANVLTGSEKLEYLQANLSGEAAQVIASIQVSDANYQHAWDLLVKRFENKREIARSHLERLFEQEGVKADGGASLRALVNRTNECIRSLEVLGAPVDKWDIMVCYVIGKKLDQDSKQQWELTFQDGSFPKLNEMLDFLDRRARALAAAGAPLKEQQKQKSKAKTGQEGSKSCNLAMSAAPSKCGICNEEHSVYKCAKLLAAGPAGRQELVKNAGLCFRCLGSGHSFRRCKAGNCRKCKKGHNTLLHDDKKDEGGEQKVDQVVAHLSCKNKKSQVLLATARVQVEDKYGQVNTVRSLIDSGSEACFVTESCVQRLGLQKTTSNTSLRGLGNKKIGSSKGKVNLIITSDFDAKFCLSVEAYVLPEVTSWQPRVPVPKNWSHLKGLHLADPSYHLPGEVDVILGNDVRVDIMREGLIKGPAGTPAGELTAFGWVLWGPVKTEQTVGSILVNHVQCDLENIVRKFWEVEEVPAKALLTAEEKLCEDHYAATTTRDDTGKYVVRLPFKANSKPLGRSRDVALRRLMQTERKLGWGTVQRTQYAEVMDEYLRMGHMVPVPATELERPDDKVYYLPHHAVIKECSTTTKLRVVYDASAKTSTGVSLNEKLMVGPTIQQDLFQILVRVRKHKIMLCADVSRMYRCVWVHQDDQDYQRILWRFGPDEPVQDFRLTTVTFGYASSPFQAIRTMHRLADDEAKDFPLAAEVIKRDFYVDDCISGADSLQVAIQLQDQLLEVLKRGGFPLRKWSSNCEALLERLPPELRETQIPLRLDSHDSIKALGIQWNPANDTFGFTVVPPPARDSITKRTVLSDVSKIFDPLGWLGPVTIRAKTLFQSLWKLDLGWDQELPQDVVADWVRCTQELPDLRDVRLPRHVCVPGANHVELHCFSDASEIAYAGAVYMRSSNAKGQCWTRLLAAKTRVAPLKTVTLPRLELCGAVLLARLTATIIEALEMKIDAVYAYTDSTVTLAWLTSQPHRWKRFVANRVAEVQEVLPSPCWRHVGTKDNPADCASRGITVAALRSHELWWNGPSWVQDGSFPESPNVPQYEGDVPEEKKEKLRVHLATTNELLDRFSSFSKLLRITAYCLRFAFNCRAGKGNHETGRLTAADLRKAEKNWVKLAQQDGFPKELCVLAYNKNGGDPPKGFPKASRISALAPMLDQDGIIRVGGRIKHSSLAYEVRHPAILPRHHRLTELLLEYEHLRGLHAGPQLMLTTLAQRYWILNGRDAARRTVLKCVRCYRFRSAPAHQMMADLPPTRVNPARPFLNCGLDYAGPLTLRTMRSRKGKKNSYRTFKGYVALFACFSTRAVHLELVSDKSSAACMAALERFVSIRGLCESITTDQATNFRGVANQLRDLMSLVNSPSHQATMANYCAEKGIKWKFNPPEAPHFGGLWEAGIKCMKHHLRRIVGNTILTFEEAATVLAKISACLNSRPLTELSSDPNDLTVLTPGHFLIGDSLLAIPEPDLTKKPMKMLTRWQLVQRITQHFWQRWSKEYLTRLQQRPKWWTQRNNVRIGDLVLIRDDDLPPLKWKLGRIQDIHPGQDGKVRAVTLKTADTTLTRPIVKISVLPFCKSD